MHAPLAAQLKSATGTEFNLYMRVCEYLRGEFIREIETEFPGISDREVWQMVATVANDMLGSGLGNGGQVMVADNGQ